jgi:predicted transposase YbfD/YdcC
MVVSPVAIKKHFARLKDPRVNRRKRHQLVDIIVIALCAVIAGADNWQKIQAFGLARHRWLKKFLALDNGIPSHDTFERVFQRLNPHAFGLCFRAWVQALAAELGIGQIAIDGKTLRGSRDGKHDLGPLHLVSAWATKAHLSLGQVAVDAKSNEITAIPRLLELLELHGALVTLDAMGCQKEIARKIVAAGADYVLTVKENQDHLLEDIQTTLSKALDSGVAGQDYDTYEMVDNNHGRQERRLYTTVYDLEALRDLGLWAKLTVVGMCYSERTLNGKTTTETRYFIGSRKARARAYGKAFRAHWGIENNLHWQLDVTFGEDANRVRGRNSTENLALIRRMALGLLKQHPAPLSTATKQYKAAMSVEFLEEIVFGAP